MNGKTCESLNVSEIKFMFSRRDPLEVIAFSLRLLSLKAETKYSMVSEATFPTFPMWSSLNVNGLAVLRPRAFSPFNSLITAQNRV